MACVQGFKETFDSGEVWQRAVMIADRNGQIIDVLHHAGLKQVLEKLIIDHSTACFYFYNKTSRGMVGVGVERLFDYSISAEQDRNKNFLSVFPAQLDLKSELQQWLPENGKNGVAVQECLARLDLSGDFRERLNNLTSQYWQSIRFGEIVPVDHGLPHRPPGDFGGPK